MAEANIVAHKLGWNDQRYPTRIGWLQRAAASNGDTPHFVLFDEDAQFVGRAKHVMIACGHGPLSFPPVLAKARQDPALADRIVQAYAPKQYDPSGRYIVIGSGHRVGQRVGERDRRGGEVHLARAQPDAGRAGSEHAALLLRGARDRRVPEPRLRPADRVPRPDPEGHRAAPPRLGGEDRDRARGGPLRADHRRDRRDQAGPARPARARDEQARGGPGLARRQRHRHRNRLQQVRALAAAAAPARRVLQGADRRGPDQAAVELRRPRPRPARLALRGDGHPRQHGDHARRHDRRAQVHRPALRRRLLRGGEAEGAAASSRAWRCRSRSRTRRPMRSGASAGRSSSPNVPDRPRPDPDARRDPRRPGDPRHDPLAADRQRGLDRHDRHLPADGRRARLGRLPVPDQVAAAVADLRARGRRVRAPVPARQDARAGPSRRTATRTSSSAGTTGARSRSTGSAG